MQKIMIDIDGVLYDMVSIICSDNGIDASKFDRYNVKDNKLLTEDEMDTIIREFGNVKAFQHCWETACTEALRSSVEKIAKKFKVVINTQCYSKEVAEFKRDKLTKLLNGIDNVEILTPVGKGMKPLEAYDVIIEDCFDNIVKAQRIGAEAGKNTFGLLIERNYNVKEYTRNRHRNIELCNIYAALGYCVHLADEH